MIVFLFNDICLIQQLIELKVTSSIFNETIVHEEIVVSCINYPVQIN